jgi:hypothetical protein
VSIAGHPPLDALLAWWLGETDAAASDAVDLHLLSCDACGEDVDQIAALGPALRAAFDAGQVGLFVGPDFLDRLRGLGRRVREYVVVPDGGVDCSVAPDDDLVVGRLRLPDFVARGDRIDAVLRSPLVAGELRLTDLPFDAERREVVNLPRVDRLRGAPAHREEIDLIAVDPSGNERPIGRYVFNHRPWAGAA